MPKAIWRIIYEIGYYGGIEQPDDGRELLTFLNNYFDNQDEVINPLITGLYDALSETE